MLYNNNAAQQMNITGIENKSLFSNWIWMHSRLFVLENELQQLSGASCHTEYHAGVFISVETQTDMNYKQVI